MRVYKSWAQALGVHQHKLFSHLKTRFKADIKTKLCLKMLYFLEKSPQRWRLRPQTSVGLRLPLFVPITFKITTYYLILE